ncbi:UDP-N-acetylmuramoyl-L-alanine--D-glutamate ligase [Corynebacterium sp. zg254]|uniref:UDP-N-acetylmuramoylalanine--D-glutamate ligase n=1 Tax=Corynebacterium zhongnanshanii TaxID=2768834 RepID=A0ABQ6VD38_9CORY|nr:MULTISPECIES: UDP-N-acetylmuramoyl-L-alanine--D-glutamate ligase [Corynebacterium]KAB3520819.1 UDP-N-acetylmuramoyl-L-alanine--D-glutamate ligase [Corynebacterium zhongnanshanii]MCR5914437.1 UDP-N-acetylmuramoyl-L-alanine--D-glutamate ligase [Corynebacterium sp. zg254]
MSTTNTLTPTQAVQIMRSRPILIAGAGVAGRGVISMLCALTGVDNAAENSNIAIADDHSDLATLSVSDAVNLLNNTDAGLIPELVITSPGWSPNSPLLQAAKQAGIPVIGDIEAAWLADQAGAFGRPRTWLAVTGTNGKTTTTAMLASMLVADGRGAVAVGNIGVSPAVALTAEQRGEMRAEVLVAEVSSFQLHWAPTFTPTVGCVLNLAEDHLDWHGSFENYAADKAAVLRAEHPVIAVDDAVVRGLPRSESAPAAYTLQDPSELSGEEFVQRVGVHEGQILELLTTPQGVSSTVLAPAEGISPPGPAGVADAAAAAAMARSVGVSAQAIASALGTFTVQAHRGQVVFEGDGVTWIDNSKATNPHAAEAALRGQENVIWVAGGQLKGASVSDLITSIAPSLKAAVVLGVDRKDIVAELARQVPEVTCVSVDSTDPLVAMQEVVRVARGLAAPGDRVILAPAAASLDMYTGMSQRGDLFAEYVSQSSVEEGES